MKKIFLSGILSLGLGLSFVACNDDDTYIYTEPILSEISTGGATTTSNTAVITGTVKGLSTMDPMRYTAGVVYATTEAALPDGGTRVQGTFGEDGTSVTTSLSGLQSDQQYFYCTYVTLQGNYSQYGEVKSFLTTDRTIATVPASSVTRTTAQLGGSLNNVDHLLAAGDEHGIYLSASADLANPVRILVDGSENSYSVKVSALIPNTTYHYASFIVMNGADAMGDVQSFTTLPATADIICDDYVDMGTKYEWAVCNLGAESPTEPGGLYGYGDLTGLLTSDRIADYPSTDISGTADDPAVKANAGLTPSAADWAELIAVCTISDETRDGVNGKLFTSNATGATLFFPYAGARTADGTVQAGEAGHYWTGSLADMSKPDYASSVRLDANVSSAVAHRTNGLSIRPVRKRVIKGLIPCDNNKIVYGNLEDNNDKFRIEIYNEYGSTKANSPIVKSMIDFSKSIAVTFSLEGVKLAAGAPSAFRATLGYADDDWNPSVWANEPGNERFNAMVTGDGTYTVYGTIEGKASGAMVFVIDIEDLVSNLEDINAVKAEIVSIYQDADLPVNILNIDSSKMDFANKDGKDKDGRVGVINPWGPFAGIEEAYSNIPLPAGSTLGVTFTISGIDGNLKAGAAGSYKGGIGFVTPSWWPAGWGPFGHAGDCTVTGDGTYTAIHAITEKGTGFKALTVDILGLWADLVDPSKVKVTCEYAGILSNPEVED